MSSRRGPRELPSRGPLRRAYLREQIGTDDATARELLTLAAEQRQAAMEAQVALLVTASRWALAHAVEEAAGVDLPGREGAVAVAGEGTPVVAEFCLAELSAVLGLSTDSGRALIGDAVELAHRLPHTWSRLLAGELSPWRARRIAAKTCCLPAEAAAFIDAEVAPRAESIPLADLENLVLEAQVRFDPESAAAAAAEAAEHRHFGFADVANRCDGLVYAEGLVDRADAADFESLVAEVAHQLLAIHPEEPLEVRRSLALGYIGRGQAVEGTAGRAREAVVYLHLSADDLRGQGGLAWLEHGRVLVDADRVRAWLDVPRATVALKPVIDLAAVLETDAYEVSDRIREQVLLRDRTCVFPWCRRAARACDADHVQPHDRGGPTRSDNIGSLCRRHHRLKTHHLGWRYEVLGPGLFLWTGPHGHRFLRGPDGTRQLDDP